MRRVAQHVRRIARLTSQQHSQPASVVLRRSSGTARQTFASYSRASLAVGVSGAAVVTGTMASCAEESGPLAEVDALFAGRGEDGRLLRSFQKLQSLYDSGSVAKSELCFRLARAAYNLISSADPGDQDSTLTKEKLRVYVNQYAEEALQVAPDDFRSSYWCGIGISVVADNEGTKYKLQNLDKMKAHFENAARLNPKDGTTQYCLGNWCYGLADLGWVARKLASTLFATPPTSTFEEALEYFLKAEEVEPGFWNKNTLMIAKTYQKLGNTEMQKYWAKMTVERACKNEEDEATKLEAAKLL